MKSKTVSLLLISLLIMTAECAALTNPHIDSTIKNNQTYLTEASVIQINEVELDDSSASENTNLIDEAANVTNQPSSDENELTIASLTKTDYKEDEDISEVIDDESEGEIYEAADDESEGEIYEAADDESEDVILESAINESPDEISEAIANNSENQTLETEVNESENEISNPVVSESKNEISDTTDDETENEMPEELEDDELEECTQNIKSYQINIDYEKEITIYDGLLPTDETKNIALNTSFVIDCDCEFSIPDTLTSDVKAIIDKAGINDSIDCSINISAHIDLDGNVAINSLEKYSPNETIVSYFVYSTEIDAEEINPLDSEGIIAEQDSIASKDDTDYSAASNSTGTVDEAETSNSIIEIGSSLSTNTIDEADSIDSTNSLDNSVSNETTIADSIQDISNENSEAQLSEAEPEEETIETSELETSEANDSKRDNQETKETVAKQEDATVSKGDSNTMEDSNEIDSLD